jgi:hypothetical protein
VDPVWQGAASLNTQRYEHAAAHLTNDQVLVAGGSDGFSTAIDSAELYTPSIDQWTETALMNEARICATSTGINDMDGTAVVVGGLNDFQNILGTAEDYDPTQDVWNELPEMNWTRMNHAATLLNDGRVLITGGIGAQNFEPDRFGGRARRPQGAKAVHTPGNPYAGASTDIFGSGGPGVTCWTFHPGGGSGSGGPGSLSSVEIWDPFTNGGQWEETNWMSYSRDRHTATLLSDGTVLAAGGYDTDFGSALSTGEVYDPVQQSWQIVPGSMSSAREDFTATLLMDGTGTVVLAGGTDGFNGPLSSVDFYIPGVGGGSGGGSGGSGGSGNLGFFMPAPPLNVARMQHVASILPNGQVLVAGGTDGVSSLGSAEVYDPVQQTWTLVDSMLYPATAPTATALQSGYVLVAAAPTSRRTRRRSRTPSSTSGPSPSAGPARRPPIARAASAPTASAATRRAPSRASSAPRGPSRATRSGPRRPAARSPAPCPAAASPWRRSPGAPSAAASPRGPPTATAAACRRPTGPRILTGSAPPRTCRPAASAGSATASATAPTTCRAPRARPRCAR